MISIRRNETSWRMLDGQGRVLAEGLPSIQRHWQRHWNGSASTTTDWINALAHIERKGPPA
jgi:hypothetical protein